MFERLKALKKDKLAALNVSGMIGAIIVVVVGLILFPLVSEQISSMTTGENASVTGIAATLLNTVPTFYLLAIMFIAIGWAVTSAKKF